MHRTNRKRSAAYTTLSHGRPHVEHEPDRHAECHRTRKLRRGPLRITIPAGRLGGVAGNYVCVAVLAGVPYPVFDEFLPGGAPGFIAPGTFPATSASPAPTGFTPPQACAYVAPPVIGADQTDWRIDCGADSDARGILGAALTQQGWRSCGGGLATARWRKNDVMLAVTESSLAPADYPRLTQYARAVSPCS